MKQQVSKAVILVGGYGTRLRPLTYTIPKPLVPFCNKPILKYQIEKLVEVGIKEVILCLNYYSEKFIEEVKGYQDEYKIKIICSKEDEPLGTAGPLALAKPHLHGCSFFVMNSDICCNVNLEAMKDLYMSKDCHGVILTYEVKDPTRYGLVKVDSNKVVSFLEKPKSIPENGPFLINAGIYVLSSEVLRMIKIQESYLEREVFPILADNNKLYHLELDGYWMDIGQPQDYLAGQNMELKNQKKTDEHSLNNVVIGINCKIGSNCALRNCTIFDNTKVEDNSLIENSLIGYNCHIKEGTEIKDMSVIGDNVTIAANLKIRGLLANPNSHIEADHKMN